MQIKRDRPESKKESAKNTMMSFAKIATILMLCGMFIMGVPSYGQSDYEKLLISEMVKNLNAKKYERAFEIGGELDKRDNAQGIAIIATLYERGLGVPANKEKAIEYYRRAAFLGEPNAQYALGNHYIIGDLVERDFVEAYTWLILAKEFGKETTVKLIDQLQSKLNYNQQLTGQKLVWATKNKIAEATYAIKRASNTDSKIFSEKCSSCHQADVRYLFGYSPFDGPIAQINFFDGLESIFYGSQWGSSETFKALGVSEGHDFGKTLSLSEIKQLVDYLTADFIEEKNVEFSDYQLKLYAELGPPPPAKRVTREEMEAMRLADLERRGIKKPVDENYEYGMGEEGSTGEIYRKFCISCHDTGVANTPKRGDIAAWEKIFSQRSLEEILERTKMGFGAMPPRGSCSQCTDEQFKDLIYRMYPQKN